MRLRRVAAVDSASMIETSFVILKVDLWNDYGNEGRNFVMFRRAASRQDSRPMSTRQSLLRILLASNRPGAADSRLDERHTYAAQADEQLVDRNAALLA